MSAPTCPRCGRERGWGLTQCSPRDHESCLGFLRDRAERERDEAKAEAERLRKLFDDAGQGEHNVLALVDHYIAEAEKAGRERDIYMAAWVADDDLRTEADELRRLAWEWCIEARYHYSAANDAHRDAGELRSQLQRLTDDAYEVDHRGNCPEPPIESLGPVPLTADRAADMSDGYPVGVAREVRVLAWLVRDAVRRGARLEGDDR